MRLPFALIALALLLVSCQQAVNTGARSTSQVIKADGGVALSPWLDQRRAIDRRQVFIAPAGSDIRRAAAWKTDPESDPSIMLIARDYSARQDDKADPQSVYVIDPAGDAQQQELAGLPLALAVGPDRQTICLAVLSETGVGSYSEEQMRIQVRQGVDTPVEVALDNQALPIAYLNDHAVQLRKVDSFQLDGGLLAPSFSRDGACYLLRMPEMQVDSRSAVYYVSPNQSRAATAVQSFDAADPGGAALDISIVPWPRSGLPSLEDYEFPLHVSYSPFAWQPQLHWVTDKQLAALVFMPELAAEGKRANYHGLFRLVTLSEDGSLEMVEDHLNGDLPFHASGGLLFYTRRAAVGDNQRWEVWASSPDGMYKRLVWSSSDPVYISLEDADAAGSLLLHVQTLKISGDKVSLESRLLSLTLSKPGSAASAARPAEAGEGGAGPLPEVPEESETTKAPQTPKQGQDSGGPPPITMPGSS